MSENTAWSSPNNWLISKLLAAVGNAPIQIVLWNGIRGCPPGSNPVGTIVIKSPRTLLGLAIDPELYYGEEYSSGRIEIKGDLLKVVMEVFQSLSRARPRGFLPSALSRWLDWRQANTPSGSRENIHRHYDIGNDFYKLWLDEQLVYTSAYFPHPSCTLEEAQIAKMDHICRKLQLRPGDRAVEAGCGWGALALHMARHYGATVKAFNISHEQILYARERCRDQDLNARVEFIEDDYRNISGKHDVFVSVGMLEHVGFDHYQEFGAVVRRCLEDNGRGFLHFIGRHRPMRFNPWIRKRIFPGAYPPLLSQAMEIFEENNFAVQDIENLRLHYARTLECWLERFDRASERVAAMYGDQFVRMWRLYLTGSCAAFRIGSLHLFQVLFTKAQNNQLPWTRAHLYSDEMANQREEEWITAIS
jgi:cyclopropane-fatty-acyl-phospholipid synthase